MDHNLAIQSASSGDMPTTAMSCDSTEGMIEAGYSFVASRGASKKPNSGSSARSNGYPFKRYPATGRPNGIGGGLLNGSEKEETSVDGNKAGVQLPIKTKASSGRGSKADLESGGAKGRSCIYSILISVVVCCFLAEALLQGSVMMLWRQTDFSLEIGYDKAANSGGLDGPERYSLEYKLKFVPWKFEERFSRQKKSVADLRVLKQSSIRPPYIALVCANLEHTPESLYMVTIAKGFQVLGYKLQLYSFEDGPMQSVWSKHGVAVNLLHLDMLHGLNVDWSNFDGVIVSSLNAKHALSSLMQEPFKGVVVVWIILEDTLGKRLRLYEPAGLRQLIFEWKQAFERADVVVFPDYTLPMMYSLLDTGNFFVIPGSPVDAWEVKCCMDMHNREELRRSFGLRSQDIALTVVGSPFTYKGVWREHAMIMRAILPIVKDLNMVNTENNSFLRLFFVSGNPTSSYGHALQVMALHLGITNGTVFHFSSDRDFDGLLWAADAVVYCSLRDEQAFPSVLFRAMAFERLIIAPNITIIQNHIVDGISGLLFSAGDIEKLTEMFSRTITKNGVMGQTVASVARSHANSLFVSDVVVGYAKLLETVLQFPSVTMLPQPISEIPDALKKEWQWQLLVDSNGACPRKTSLANEGAGTSSLVYELEKLLISSRNSSKSSQTYQKEDNEWLSHAEWEEEKATQLADDLERREEEQIEERRELLRGTWEDIYKVVKKIERVKNELHERDDGELERTGQPLCIYEPYNGVGAWSFLHQSNALYRGISMSSRQKRSGYDDIDAALRLPLLNNSYYQDALCEYGAFFAIANRIDRVHKNAWIGFQSWRAAGRKAALSTEAEKMLVDAIRIGRHGDAVYFWARMDDDISYSKKLNHQDFWSLCETINNDNCRSVFLNVFKQMYGLPSSWTSLPPMPVDGGSWSALHCWAMPTSSFLEFVMFARIFVDALDSQNYIEHHDEGKCCLGIAALEVKHCYCRLLELLVNVWAYHSARRMIFVDPVTGTMHEHHSLDIRHGHMWVRFFDYNTVKGIDEDLAEEADDERPTTRWLWPQTGEVFWQGVFERERREHYFSRLEKKRKNKERLERIRSRYRQKPLAGR